MLLQLRKIVICCFGVLLLIPMEGAFAQKKGFTVVIDPGHGGRDPGAIGSGSKEKDIVLAVGKRLGELIRNNHPDVNVLYTRESDKFVELNRRAEIANKAKADLFISLHCNALDRRKRSPQGVETFVLGLHRSKDNLDVAKAENSVILYEEDYSTKYQGFDPNEPESYIMFEFMTDQYLQQSVYFASLVQNRLVNNSKRVNRNVRQAGFLVLREVAMPSILVELGYISNATDERYMKSESGQKSLANSVYLAFKEYKREYDKKSQVLPSAQQRTTETAAVTTEVAPDGTTEYRIQFLTSPRRLADNSPQLKGLNPVDYYIEGTTYKYTYGRSSDLKEATKTLKTVQSKFKDAFIVEFRNGKRVK
ncbi:MULTISPECIES: N-acetylmuramoyl-L-alanine amidase family protein [Petrimonas]|jgi:N-acetylmuramoyl-L-alanine amidase|uniref:N-acetylmuramoyl-L-alanine amidase n=1 Tax=Petrimonas mucosa TaxID=1642646 RepID=A0A1G4GBE2_9BACT|nr:MULTISPECIES: N-acetylmuramoyl-L-alanine amidase [Petrimonas]SCM59880.1 N-acetylmuramoyl-L-alanine amidase AmiB [Petrimonas mucosa]SFU47416.1 N-acetylmuramoyl-L-alanine amidase [Porphyromonadaceae bacterium KHP3R9]